MATTPDGVDLLRNMHPNAIFFSPEFQLVCVHGTSTIVCVNEAIWLEHNLTESQARLPTTSPKMIPNTIFSCSNNRSLTTTNFPILKGVILRQYICDWGMPPLFQQRHSSLLLHKVSENSLSTSMSFSSCTSKLYLLILGILECFCDD